jgi:phage terminase large subunit-like protein
MTATVPVTTVPAVELAPSAGRSLMLPPTAAATTRSSSAANLRRVFSACANDPTSSTDAHLEEILQQCPPDQLRSALADWHVWARDEQLPPVITGDGWRTWLFLGGRGAGKTRAGAEWVRAMALGERSVTDQPARRIALIAETHHDARSVMVEGVSGLLAVHGDADRPLFEPSKSQLVWPNGSIAQLFSGDDPSGLRGPQFDAAWCDELAKWRRADATWDMLQFALRLGSRPRQLVTTTPRNLPLLARLLADPMTRTTRAATAMNAANLAPSFVAEMQRRYAGTALGRQELDGEIITEVAGALWRQDWLETQRVAEHPELTRIVVALDPPVTATQSSDACGIVVAGLGEDGRGYVLADRTVQGRQPHEWARAAIAAFHDFKADRLVAEANQGGEMVVSVLRQVDPTVPISKVHATRGKWLRAEPVAALYAEGRVLHVGRFDRLEDQMCSFGGGGAGGQSPDRLDALVWALTALMLDRPVRASVRVL